MKKQLSIIIPMYNMRDYIVECLNSLIVSDNMDDLEVLVINDGSTDNSYELAHNFESRYPNTFKVFSKNNGHYGSCINYGLSKATGEYVKILDADDYFETKTLGMLLSLIKNINVDLIITDALRVYPNKTKKDQYLIEKNTVLPFTNICKNKKVANMTMHSVIYKRKLLIDMDYKQSEGIMYTDNEFVFKPMSAVNTVYYLPETLYCYRLGREGQSVDSNVQRKCFSHEIQVTKALLKAYSEISNVPVEIDNMLQKKLFHRLEVLYKIKLIKWEEYQDDSLIELDNLLKTISPSVYADLGNILMSNPILPFKYISIWRKRNYKRLRAVIKLYKHKKKLL